MYSYLLLCHANHNVVNKHTFQLSSSHETGCEGGLAMRAANVYYKNPWNYHCWSPGNQAGPFFSSGLPGTRSIPEFGRC